jgi:hypothetical protein
VGATSPTDRAAAALRVFDFLLSALPAKTHVTYYLIYRETLRETYFIASSLFYFCLSISLLSGVGCKSKEKETVQGGAAKVQKAGDTITLAGTLIEKLPEQTMGFVYLDLKSESYKKMMTSPWGSSNNWMSLSKSPEFAEISKVLTGLGIDPSKPETWNAVVSEGAIFVVPDTVAPLPVAAVIKSGSAEKVTAIMATFKQELQKHGKTFVDHAVEGGSGLEIDIPADGEAAEGAPQKLFVLAKGDMAAMAADAGLAKQALSGSALAPKILQSGQFKRAFEGLGSKKESFSIGYLDIAALIAGAKQFSQQVQNDPSTAAVKKIESVVWASGMKDTPEQEMRIVFTDEGAQAIKDLKVSGGEQIAKYVPATPMAVLSLDAAVFAPMLDYAQASQPQAGAVTQQLPWLKDLKKVGLAVTVSQPGMLPIPNILISLQVAQSKQVEEFLRTTLQQMVAASGMAPESTWQTAEKNGVSVSSMQGPMGLSLNIASKDDVVILGNNAQELDGLLGSTTGKSVAPALVQSTIGAERILGMTLDFAQVSKFMQTMGGY